MPDIMTEYKNLVEFLGKVLPKNCEIALQDVRSGKNCITAIANGHISGRKEGSPLTNLAIKFINEETWKDNDFITDYTGCTKEKKRLRSSTYFIKENGRLSGMLCINIDDSSYMEISRMLFALGGIPQAAMDSQVTDTVKDSRNMEPESFYEDIEDLTEMVINEYFSDKSHVPSDRLNQTEKMDIVSRLEEKGVFMVKGSVSKVARRLSMSDASMYRYLSKIEKEKAKQP
ncbi:helix-turn-helix transcriptional regulator [Youngiibacter multivorans]|uniref:Transcriptional regulator YheO n=1 Tax=Youngiibacter multivorans TaxID=937251 RepID=A0ABS4G7T6_9CLOT|nr:PAS domain-containing protein [Youngiibacter multivorans]MBP1920611.1 putative transcriptional regulator YheO [Youngiibacter multivorans]